MKTTLLSLTAIASLSMPLNAVPELPVYTPKILESMTEPKVRIIGQGVITIDKQEQWTDFEIYHGVLSDALHSKLPHLSLFHQMFQQKPGYGKGIRIEVDEPEKFNLRLYGEPMELLRERVFGEDYKNLKKLKEKYR